MMYKLNIYIKGAPQFSQPQQDEEEDAFYFRQPSPLVGDDKGLLSSNFSSSPFYMSCIFFISPSPNHFPIAVLRSSFSYCVNPSPSHPPPAARLRPSSGGPGCADPFHAVNDESSDCVTAGQLRHVMSGRTTFYRRRRFGVCRRGNHARGYRPENAGTEISFYPLQQFGAWPHVLQQGATNM